MFKTFVHFVSYVSASVVISPGREFTSWGSKSIINLCKRHVLMVKIGKLSLRKVMMWHKWWCIIVSILNIFLFYRSTAYQSTSLSIFTFFWKIRQNWDFSTYSSMVLHRLCFLEQLHLIKRRRIFCLNYSIAFHCLLKVFFAHKTSKSLLPNFLAPIKVYV